MWYLMFLFLFAAVTVAWFTVALLKHDGEPSTQELERLADEQYAEIHAGIDMLCAVALQRHKNSAEETGWIN